MVFLETISDVFKMLIVPRARGKSLEIGCGTGYLIAAIAEKNSDVEHTAIDMNDYREFKPKNVKFLNKDFENLKVDERFDTVVMIHVLEHLKNPAGMIEKINSLLNKGGQMILMVPNRKGFMNQAKLTSCEEWSPHLWLFDKETIEHLLEKLGYKYRFLKSYMHIPFSGRLSRKNKFMWNLFVQLEYLFGKIAPIGLQPSLFFIVDKK
jgi:2-polyprenyl-3-methyl-5-hydroxy-6-metoxy-1,4-benzoquinol methylase